jgi:hypothetical protein
VRTPSLEIGRIALASREVKERRRSARLRFGDSGAKLLILVLGSTMAGVWMIVPRPVPPTEPPSLTLDGSRVRAVVEQDRRRAAAVPRSEAVLTLERLIGAQNLAEVGPGEPAGAFDARRRSLHRAAARVHEDHGDGALDAMRARDTIALGDALEGGMDPQERRAHLGSFPRMMDRYGLRVGARSVAPPFVVRTLFKARWNALIGLEPTVGFEPVERLAYWGWLALHAEGAPLALREGALDGYAAAGGGRLEEARAALALRAGRLAPAAQWMVQAHRSEGGPRLRNHSLWLLAEAGRSVDSDSSIP